MSHYLTDSAQEDLFDKTIEETYLNIQENLYSIVKDNLPAPGTTELEQDFYQDNIDLISESIINEFSAFINLNT